jgi:hypothetical protein
LHIGSLNCATLAVCLRQLLCLRRYSHNQHVARGDTLYKVQRT